MEIPYGKITVYVLTFIGYIYSGYGAGLLGNIREAVLSAESIFGDVMNNLLSVANQIHGISQFVNYAVEEECVFKCPGQGVTPKPNKNYKPGEYGCGSQGLKIESKYLPVAEMTKCCEKHDGCYDRCGADKEVCDVEFKRCLYRYCDIGNENPAQQTACKGAAKILYTGTLALGCKAFMEAQSQACYCAPVRDKRSYKYTSGGGDL